MSTMVLRSLTPWKCLLMIIHLTTVMSQNPGILKMGHVMLSGGKVPNEGNVMVAADKETKYLPLCDDDFGMAEANAVCLRLGYSRALRFTRQNFFRQQTSRWTPDGWMSMYNLDCSELSNERSHNLDDCILSRNQKNMCDVSEVAGVVCLPTGDIVGCSSNDFVCADGNGPSQSCIPETSICDGDNDCSDGSDEHDKLCNREGIFRLESNIEIDPPENTVEGNVLIKYNKIWSTVCNAYYGRAEAKVVCRSLGYGGGMAVAVMGSYFGTASRPILISDYSCSGQETSLTQCPDFLWTNDSNCHPTRAAGVVCHSENIDVQLVGGEIDSGHLELRSSGLSSSAAVCGIGFDDLDAQVICRMLGYDPLQATASRHSPPGLESDFIWNVILDCKGHEQSIQHCRVMITNTTCAHEDTAYVSCSRGHQKSVDDLLSDVLPKDCGQPVDSSDRILTNLAKIRGGKISPPFDAPWLAALHYRTRPGFPLEYLHTCGAAIISEYYLLTAAHCFRTQGKLGLIVRVAEYNNNFDESFQQDFFIDKVWIHESFEEIFGQGDDIALLKIEAKNGRGIRLGERAKAVCLPRVGDSYNDLESCTVAGWGRVTNSSNTTVIPNVINIRPTDDEHCERTFSSKVYTSSGACIWNYLKNPCRGDSGGSVTCRVPGGRHVVYGLVSYGRPCVPDSAFVSVVTRVTKYLRWIQEIIYKDLRLDY